MGSTQITNLTCEYRVNPIGLDTLSPRFTWQFQADDNNMVQTAYHIQVADVLHSFDSDHLVWDSGKVGSEQSDLIAYEGSALHSRHRYYYRIKAWDQSELELEWSETAFFELGLLGENDWSASWITPDGDSIDPNEAAAFYLRKTFATHKPISKATIYATSLGIYELELNGVRVGDWEFTPGWTSYRHRLQVQSYDVTAALQQGELHTIGAVLANGWYKGNLAWKDQHSIFGEVRALLLQLHIDYADGTSEVVASDDTWRASTGPIRMSELYHGETYDANLEQDAWSLPRGKVEEWHAVTLLAHSKSILIMQENEPARITERLKPIDVIQTPSGETVLDFGQNMVGKVHMRLDLPVGSRIQLLHAEVLDRDGNFYIGNLRSAKQTVTYICKGGGEEQYEPHFSFQGFRYVKVLGWPLDVALEADRFTGHVIHTDMVAKGNFVCSNPLLNQLQANIVWGQRGNFLDVPTDCPQRDERLGWTGDAQVFIRTAAFNYGVAPFFSKWLRDLKADQYENGGVPFVIPHVLSETDHSSSAWGDAAVICPWTLYQVYGDTRVLEEQYDSMKAWITYMRNQGENEYLWNTGFHFGDWLGLDAKEGSYIGATPRDLIASCFYAYSTSLFIKAAKVLGRREDVTEYSELYEHILAAFNEEFMTPSGRLAAHTQTAHVLPLMFGLVSGRARERLAKTLAEYVVEQNYHLTTGFVGTPYLCQVLSDNGYHDVAVKLVQQEDYPSWLYAIHKGATTIWEHWDGIKPDGSFWSDNMNSYNHYAYGSIGDWLYRTVAGLDSDDEQAGYKRLIFRPRTDSALEFAKAAFQSNYGLNRSEWRKEADGTVVYVFELPPNTTGGVTLRGASAAVVTINDQTLSQGTDSKLIDPTDEELHLELGSGVYEIRVAPSGMR
ncbi:glycoside hydrolase family 78 protein [Paenibacillus sp. HWE-109]|uniref:alpha-L-rhamnosidase n=1 Tax=Paenibacillus sp. HWE-109 TaxID=1306526 RepID=UPI001EDEE9B4|nr:alpha-L-rhamnosidase [Paenibacillus sp. HWE-109]UKS28841.1 glycoside hydrolase family 78 protein [Paenibacillus sp. HWE-109]